MAYRTHCEQTTVLLLTAATSHNFGFRHRKITPYLPRANAEVERFMRTVKKIIKTSIYERRDWKTEMYRFLRNYRATPHSTTGFPPATILFARSMKVKLPELHTEQSSQSPIPRDKVQRRDYHQKEKMKR